MSEWTDAIVESMSTAELCSALRGAEGDELARGPSPRLVERMEQEWRDRPARDRIQAEALLRESQ